MRILVTGAAGLLGSHLVDRLIVDGHELLALDNLSTGSWRNLARHEGAENVIRLEQNVVAPIDFEGEIDRIYHLASPASPIDFTRIPFEIMEANVAGTRRCLELAEKCQARFLFASTSEVYGDPEVSPQPEEYRGNVSTTGVRAVYDEAKRFGETAVSAFSRYRGVDCRIARIFNTYGTRMRADDGRAVPSFITSALRGESLKIFGDGEQTRSFAYVTDTIDGLVRLMESDERRPVNIGSDLEITIRDLAERIAKLAGRAVKIETGPAVADDPQRRRPDLTRARESLGYAARVSLDDGLAMTVADFRDRA